MLYFILPPPIFQTLKNLKTSISKSTKMALKMVFDRWMQWHRLFQELNVEVNNIRKGCYARTVVVSLHRFLKIHELVFTVSRTHN